MEDFEQQPVEIGRWTYEGLAKTSGFSSEEHRWARAAANAILAYDKSKRSGRRQFHGLSAVDVVDRLMGPTHPRSTRVLSAASLLAEEEMSKARGVPRGQRPTAEQIKYVKRLVREKGLSHKAAAARLGISARRLYDLGVF